MLTFLFFFCSRISYFFFFHLASISYLFFFFSFDHCSRVDLLSLYSILSYFLPSLFFVSFLPHPFLFTIFYPCSCVLYSLFFTFSFAFFPFSFLLYGFLLFCLVSFFVVPYRCVLLSSLSLFSARPTLFCFFFLFFMGLFFLTSFLLFLSLHHSYFFFALPYGSFPIQLFSPLSSPLLFFF